MAIASEALDRKRPATMIQPLRQTHFRIWAVLPVLLALLFVAGLLVRRPTLPRNAGVHWEKYK